MSKECGYDDRDGRLEELKNEGRSTFLGFIALEALEALEIFCFLISIIGGG